MSNGRTEIEASSVASHAWTSPEAFVAAGTANSRAGRHSIACATLTLELVIPGAVDATAPGTVLPVLFSTGPSNTLPIAADAQVLAQIASIRIVDPVVASTAGVTKGWFAGDGGCPLQAPLAQALRVLAEYFDVELLLVGGDAAGFAALQCAQHLGACASVLVWNPQTDWLAYDENTVRAYLAAAFPQIEPPVDSGKSFQARVGDALDQLHAVHSLIPALRERDGPRRMLYLQNASDWHVQRHAAPFLKAGGFNHAGNGFHSNRAGNALVWFGHWGEGHQSPPRNLIEFLFARMLDPQTAMGEVESNLERQGFQRYIDAAQAPRDLLHDASQPGLLVAASSDGSTLLIEAQLDGIPEGEGQIAYAFYVFAGEERIAIRWYERSAVFELAEDSRRPATHVAVFVRDGLGQQLAHRTARVGRSSRKIQRACGRRVFIYGSCVSRDAFQFADHGLHLVGYIARSSLASAFDSRLPPAALVEAIGKIPSAFQRRMVGWDLRRSAADILRAAHADIVLLDLVDERFSLLDAEGALVTLSGEFMKVGHKPDPECVIAPGSPRHMDAWERGMRSFLDVVGRDRVVVNKVRWATHDDHGEPLVKQEWIARSNDTLSTMYDALAEQGVRFIAYPDELFVADHDHKWGVSPFHYTQAMYAHIMAALEQMLTSPAAESRDTYKNTEARNR